MTTSIGQVMPAMLLISSLLLSACKKAAEPEGYRVLSYEAATHQWTILRTGTFDGQFLRKRLVVVCSFYKWGEHEAVEGPDACHLQVGRLIVPNTRPKNLQDFLMVTEMPTEVLSITEGDGPDRVMQQFNILKYELLPDGR
jgi:hypothetical protein